MSEEEITELFNERINERGIGKKLGVTKAVVYNYRNRAKLTTGDMLDILFKIDAIIITRKDESQG